MTRTWLHCTSAQTIPKYCLNYISVIWILAYGVCLKYLKEPESSKDAVLAIFEELQVKLKKHEVNQFRGWLYTVVKNYCLMQLRSAKSIKMSPLDETHMQFTEDRI